ncbi:uncharacterized protein RSE6_09399 [Rhynchosporium secalis]|uniref:Zn(2)-C6 fungal-type domain-containing protein n=1 Tax=Rhynchosporium secalis TaxID=38038 RepID=A0A1E1MHX8_RHYSE|nr:uncharacterized protein RSE6_09399 [Rhynchosporium secalis]
MSELGKKRARKPKTKTGIRRVKCDEDKPSCLRCTSTGRKCDGYKSTSSLIESQDHSQQYELSLASMGIGIRNISSVLLKDGEEIRAFDFFRHRTAADLSGFFPSQFWDGLLLKASYSEPAILHAVIALGTLHEMFQDGKSGVSLDVLTSEKRKFALQQSNMAIGYLTRPSSNFTPRSSEAVLMACLLFICLEVFQGNHNSAIAHLDSGLKIMRSMGCSKPHANAKFTSAHFNGAEQNDLMYLFCRLDIQASTYLPGRQTLYDLPTGGRPFLLAIRVPESFSSISEANISLHIQVCEVVRFIHPARQYRESAELLDLDMPLGLRFASPLSKELLVTQKERTKQLDRWLNTMNAFLKDPKVVLGPQDLRGAVLLKMQQITTSIMLASTIFNDQTEYDRLTLDFERVIVLASNLLMCPINSTKKVEQKPYCSFDMGVVPSLYNAACRCRDPFIRRRAISLLEQSARREGIWGSDVSAAVAKRIMEIEERDLGSVVSAKCVPMEARIHNLDKTFVSGERKCFVRFQNGRMEFIEEWITW